MSTYYNRKGHFEYCDWRAAATSVQCYVDAADKQDPDYKINLQALRLKADSLYRRYVEVLNDPQETESKTDQSDDGDATGSV